MKSFFEWFKASTKVKRWIMLILIGMVCVCYSISEILVTTEMNFSMLGRIAALFVFGVLLISISIVFIQKRNLELIIEANDNNEITKQDARVNIKSLIFNKKVYENGPKIVVLGGGPGLNTILRGLKKYTNNLTAIVTVSSYGKRPTISREMLDFLPTEDIKDCIVAMSDREDLMSDLMKLNFSNTETLHGLNFGDIYLYAMDELYGNISESIRKSTEVLNITGKVMPVTLDEIEINAELNDGTIIKEKDRIPQIVHSRAETINRIFITPTNCKAAPGVIEALEEAEAIIVAPGSLYTNVLPNLLVKNIAKTIYESKALKFYLSNIMTERGQTDAFTLSKHLKVIKEHVGMNLFDYCLVDTGEIVPEYIRKYNNEGREIVEADVNNIEGVKVIERNMSKIIDGHIRHDPDVVAQIIIDFICNELKYHDQHQSTEYLLLQSVLKEQRKKQAKKEKLIAKGKLPKEEAHIKKTSKYREKYNERIESVRKADKKNRNIARDKKENLISRAERIAKMNYTDKKQKQPSKHSMDKKDIRQNYEQHQSQQASSQQFNMQNNQNDNNKKVAKHEQKRINQDLINQINILNKRRMEMQNALEAKDKKRKK